MIKFVSKGHTIKMEHSIERLRDIRDVGRCTGDCHVGRQGHPQGVSGPSAPLRRLLHPALRERQSHQIFPQTVLELGSQTRLRRRLQSR